MITQETYDRLFALMKQLDKHEESLIPRAREIAREFYGPDLWKFTFAPEWVYTFLDEDHDHPNCFPSALMWDPDWQKTIVKHKEEERRRIDSLAAASALREQQRVEKAERAELARLKAKYPEEK